MMLRDRLMVAALLGAIVTVPACESPTSPSPPAAVETRTTFDEDFDGWSPRAIEVVVGGDDEIDWEIVRSEDRAAAGSVSVRMFAHNRTDAARLWLEREYQLEPNTEYDVTIEFAFATADWSDVNLWTVLAGALTQRPETAEDLVPTHRDDTRAGDPPGDEYVWQERRYDATVQSGSDGRVHVVVGIWGTSEFQRTYYIDDVRVTLTPR